GQGEISGVGPAGRNVKLHLRVPAAPWRRPLEGFRPIVGGVGLLNHPGDQYLVLTDHRALGLFADDAQGVATVRVAGTGGTRSLVTRAREGGWFEGDSRVGAALAMQGDTAGNGRRRVRPPTARRQKEQKRKKGQGTHGCASSMGFEYPLSAKGVYGRRADRR